MTTFGQGNNQSKANSQKTISPFAGSLLENEQKSPGSSPNQNRSEQDSNSFANALLNSSGRMDEAENQDLLRKQQEELLLKQKKEALRKKLHDRVNPVDSYDLFSAKEEKSKKELNEVRKELELLIADIKDLSQEIEAAVSQDIVAPGIDGGSYYTNFFHQLRQLIMLLRQKVGSASSWAQQMQGKGKKKQGLNYKKTKDVHSGFNNERNAGANAVG
ncbi:MAG: hypothetical protein UT13_C0001G0700 [Candidatus Pacebacteria bacterium GW2011_GWF2_38_9]|nr:MAG: hypothetical protein US01_C0001G0731 [candidate division TM6 bacterium GW2011_GWF2_28_16]KKQ10096.1 MAG: hypothetical protein US20_C0003G0036 [Candidatus Pacebacteria bacterium GW2011_GWF1_36_5]KKQ89052.1 MAG: hypothetical protein UT13_C0001G0700 [Candidatus Pacebacteria bacterium GW2011_GWF2_38_9]HAZ73554.1 hypothetical protein [Candidatus Paceibacterota bacterium]